MIRVGPSPGSDGALLPPERRTAPLTRARCSPPVAQWRVAATGRHAGTVTAGLWSRPGLFLFDAVPDAGEVTLHGAEGRHAADVKRVKPGEVILLGTVPGRAPAPRDRRRQGPRHRHDPRRRHDEPPAVTITLAQALAKGDRGELAVELATEAGVDGVVPWRADRCVTRWDDGPRAPRPSPAGAPPHRGRQAGPRPRVRTSRTWSPPRSWPPASPGPRRCSSRRPPRRPSHRRAATPARSSSSSDPGRRRRRQGRPPRREPARPGPARPRRAATSTARLSPSAPRRAHRRRDTDDDPPLRARHARRRRQRPARRLRRSGRRGPRRPPGTPRPMMLPTAPTRPSTRCSTCPRAGRPTVAAPAAGRGRCPSS